MRKCLWDLDGKPEVRWNGRGRANVGCGPVRPVERRVDLDSGKTRGVSRKMRTFAEEKVAAVPWERPAGASDTNGARAVGIGVLHVGFGRRDGVEAISRWR
jgi:hypothetical protein